MQQYETIFICKPELPESEIQAVLDRLLASINNTGGKTLLVDEWGSRKLAYPVRYRGQRFTRGYYIMLKYLGSGESVHEVERGIKLVDEAFRYLTIKLEEDIEEAGMAEMTHRKPEARLEQEEEEEQDWKEDEDEEQGQDEAEEPDQEEELEKPSFDQAEVSASENEEAESEEPDSTPSPDEEEEDKNG